jgi:hypothetical protein
MVIEGNFGPLEAERVAECGSRGGLGARRQGSKVLVEPGRRLLRWVAIILEKLR